MATFNIDDALMGHWRANAAEAAGIGIWAMGGLYCVSEDTDGHIPYAVAKGLVPRPATAIRKAVESGLWMPCDVHEDCYLMRAFHRSGKGRVRHKTPAERELERESARVRQASSRRNRHGQFSPGPDLDSTPVTPLSQRDTPVTRPVTQDVTERDRIRLDTPSSNEVPPLSPPQGGTAPRAARPARRPTTIPTGWAPNDGHRTYAAQHRIDVEVEAAKFRDHAQMNGRLGKDWDAGFRMWLTKAVEFQASRPAVRPEPTPKPLRRFTADD